MSYQIPDSFWNRMLSRYPVTYSKHMTFGEMLDRIFDEEEEESQTKQESKEHENMSDIVKNGRISRADIGYDYDDRVFVIKLDIECNDSHYSYNDHNLSDEGIGAMVRGIINMLDVENWSEVQGSMVRVEAKEDYTKIDRLGHIIEERWFDPYAIIDRLRAEGGRQ